MSDPQLEQKFYALPKCTWQGKPMVKDSGYVVVPTAALGAKGIPSTQWLGAGKTHEELINEYLKPGLRTFTIEGGEMGWEDATAQ